MNVKNDAENKAPEYEGVYCGIGAWTNNCPHQIDHPTKPAREYCTLYKRTLQPASGMLALRCISCRKENP